MTMSPLAFDELPRTTSGSGATERIARALYDSGIDAPSSLYDEALSMAREGRLAPACERLRMLLVLDPSDADASLLLGKVLAKRGLWQESLAHLDTASANGSVLPPGLRDEVEAKLRKQIQEAEEHRARVAARERGEIRNLRSEAKRLRSDNAALEIQIEELAGRVKLWSSATALVSGVAAALLVGMLLFGNDSSEVVTETNLVVPTATVSQVTEEAVIEPLPTDTVAPATTNAIESTPTPVINTPIEPVSPAPVETVSSTPDLVAIHTVRKGDTLGKIARQYWGKSSLWPELQAANAEMLGEGIDLSLGMKIKVPARD